MYYYLNDLVEEDFVLTQNNLAALKMPNKENFYIDNRKLTSNWRKYGYYTQKIFKYINS
jgi:hypothetical protein